MVSEKFRRQLRQEAQTWRDRGIIDPPTYTKLAECYQFAEIESAARNRFIAILMAFGGILMGLGALAFAAANWGTWPRAYRSILLMSLFVGVNGTGFYLWRAPSLPKAYRSLGQGLLILGAIVLGANMMLMSQMFYESGRVWELFLVWGLGVLMMAYSLRLTSLGVLAILLIETGYWLGVFGDRSWETLAWIELTIEHMSLVAGFLFVPLAYWCRSRVIFALSAIAVSASLVVAVLRWQGLFLEVAFLLPPALLWGYSDKIWRFSLRCHPSNSLSFPEPFKTTSRSLAVCFLAFLFYSLSFNRWTYIDRLDLTPQQWQQNLPTVLDIGILSSITMLGWIQFRFRLNRWKSIGIKAVNTATIACFLTIAGCATYWHLSVERIPTAIAIVFNVMLFCLASGLIRDGLTFGSRRTFWGGLLLFVLGIATRTIEYKMGLILKSLVFALCGVGVTIAGLWFERNEKNLKHRSTFDLTREETS